MKEPRFYIYKMTTDVGAAPCVIDEQLLTLAICKPRIRRGAVHGDFIFGFAGKTLGDGTHGGKLIYVAKVNKNLPKGSYYREEEYRTRPDCIYEWNEDRLDLRPDRHPTYHDENDKKSDIGCAPGYKNANVLVCVEFRYFGVQAWHPDKTRYPLLVRMLDVRLRGERVNHSNELRDELRNLLEEAFQRESIFYGLS
jgi:hypothetical protein